MSETSQPERLWQRLKHAGFGTRRRIAQLIDEGAVLLNGERPSPVARLSPDSLVTVHGQPVHPPARLRYWLLHKPVGVDCCIKPEQPHSIAHILSTLPPGLFPAGRLDKDSGGLLLLTNDGLLCQRLLHPDYLHEKEYQVVVDRDLTAYHLDNLRSGNSYQVGPRTFYPRPCGVTQTAPKAFRIVLTEGMHRQIRRMCRAVGLTVVTLQRIRLNQLSLGDLAPGEARELAPDEITQLRASPQTSSGGIACGDSL